ncbi:hypothetical protein M0R72_19615 [Candidatus Pacearchaeota archaeon]|jgi:hypothetical protein|nr:hypothetical protein [Candidatus Pacearchaeota archaeon]
MKYWYTVKHYCCELCGENYGDAIRDEYKKSNAPNCDGCPIIDEWKASGLTKEKFREMMEKLTYH